ncbi:MAG TPA: hypothetical protein VJ927_12245 [Actinomycetota bacterium]|nr:hypothetical protein [Actinomycetota bacterium]
MRRSTAASLIVATALATSLVAEAGATSRRDSTALRSRAYSQLNRSYTATAARSRAVAPVSENFEVLSHLKLKGRSPEADVFVYDHARGGKHAYLGTGGFPCAARGVQIVRTERPRFPRRVARAAARPGTSTEDVVVARIGGRDIMATGVQVCGDGGVGGLALYNVTNPSEPRAMSFMRMPAFGVHELDIAVRPDGRVLALLAVPVVEAGPIFGEAPRGGDFRIVDITRPKNPVAISDFGVIGDSALADFSGGAEVDIVFRGLGVDPTHLDHSARAADDGMTAYVSYWDAGVLKFDISDPAAPVLLARTMYPPEAEGNAHSLVPYDVDGERYLLQNDEDYFADAHLAVTSTATGATEYAGIQYFWMPTTLAEGDETTLEVFDAGGGCTAAAYDGAEGTAVLVDVPDPFLTFDAPCLPEDQILLAAAANAGVLVLNWIGPTDPCGCPPPPNALQQILDEVQDMPVALIADNDGMAEAIRTRPGSGPIQMTLTPREATRGYIRVFKESDPTDVNDDGVPEFEQVGEFSDLPFVAADPAAPLGDWTVHNTEILGTRAYSSWYSHGIVALDLTDPTAPVKVGQFRRSSTRRGAVFGPEGFPYTWGVVIDPATGHVYASDMRSGLWILRPTGAAANPPAVP